MKYIAEIQRRKRSTNLVFIKKNYEFCGQVDRIF